MALRRLLLPTAAHAPAVVTAAGITGIAVGGVVAAFEWVTQEQVFHWLLGLPLAVQAVAPLAGLILAALLVRYVGGGSPSTSDEYVRAFHEGGVRLPLSQLPGRLAAGVATIGFGGAMGLEGPAIFAGATIGSAVKERLTGVLRRDDLRVLLTAGAAAGVAAVFKTPATGVLFALEAPYRDDVARRALLPALVASAASYLTFVALSGPEPVIPRLGTTTELTYGVVGGAVLLGASAGLAGRGFSWVVQWSKALQRTTALPWRIAGAGATLGALAVLSDQLFDAPLTLGAGYGAIEWARDPEHALSLVALLLAFRIVATVASIVGGGVGGLFIPLVAQGVLLGRLIGGLVGQPEADLFPILGLAAFLGAGYRTPIAAVMFVAESSFGENYIIPALIAAAVSQLVAGSSTVSGYQRAAREGHLERRLSLPITAALKTDVLTVPPDATVAELVFVHVLGNRERIVPVVERGRYVGMCGLPQIGALEREDWESTTVGEILTTDIPVAGPSWVLRDATAAMDRAAIDVLPVVDGEGGFVGLVPAAEIVKLSEILEETGG